MANKKMAGGDEPPDNNAAPWFDARDVPAYWTDAERESWGVLPKKSHRELLAEIERLADWTIYDGPDPAREGGPKKPPSTTIPAQPRDWAKRAPDGTWSGPAIPRKKK